MRKAIKKSELLKLLNHELHEVLDGDLKDCTIDSIKVDYDCDTKEYNWYGYTASIGDFPEDVCKEVIIGIVERAQAKYIVKDG